MPEIGEVPQQPEQSTDSPTSASDAAADRIGTRIKRGFIDIAGIHAGAIGFALGAWADSRAAMIASAAIGVAATGKFVKDIVSIRKNNPADEALVRENDPAFQSQMQRLREQEAELVQAAKIVNGKKREA